MVKLFHKATKNKFIRNVMIIASGTALAQLIGILSIPIITRIYGPDAFGVLGTYLSLINIVGPLAALSYPIAIVLPKEENKAQHIIKLSFIICFMTVMISSLILLLFSNAIVEIFNLQLISSFMYLIPIVILLSGVMQIGEQWLIKTKQFTVSAKTNVIQAVLVNLSKIGVGLYYPLAASLILAQTSGIAIRGGLMILLSSKPLINRKKMTDKLDIVRVAREYKDFPIYRSPQVFLSTISYGLPILLLASLSGPAAAGFYTLGRQVLGIPVQLLGKAIQDVFYPRVSEAFNNEENINWIIIKSVLVLTGIGLIPFGIVIVFGPQIFSFVFGASWFEAGIYARWIALMSYSMLITRPIVVSLPVLNIQRQFLIFEVVGTVIKVCALLLGFYYFKSEIYAIALFSIIGAGLYVYLTFYTLSVAKRYANKN